MDKKILVNPNLIFSIFSDKKKYLLLKNQDEYVPFFIKNEYIEILEYIKNNEITIGDTLRKFDKDIDVIVDTFLNCGFISSNNNFKVITINNLNDRLNKLNDISYKTRTPLLAKFELTYNCNFRCKYCYIEGLDTKMLSYDEIKIALKKLKYNGVNEIYLTGGEPFLHPQIMEIISLCDEIGLITCIQTNGSFINEQIAQRLSNYNHLKIFISFHSANKDKFDEFTEVENSFDKVMKAQKYLERFDINYAFKLNVTSYNEGQIKDNIVFLEKNNIPFDIYIQTLPDIGDNKETMEYMISEKTIKWLYENEYLKFHKTRCSAAIGKLWISPFGDVYPCELYRVKLGNLIVDDFEDIWNGKKAKETLESYLYKDIERCLDCDKADYCNKCLAYMEFEKWTNPLLQFCHNAKVVKQIMVR